MFFRMLFVTVIILLSSMCTFAQEYAYDAHGNLVRDGNKQIQQVHYNHLSLADTITYADGRQMIYTYTATGQKLGEQSLLANGSIKQKRDYVDHFLYRNDSLREIDHEDGRVVPLFPGSNATSWEYQYHLNDHLGNVRSILTSKPETENNTSTFESAAVATEQNRYLRYAVARKINSILFDHTHTGATHYAERLNGSANERYGIARSLSVMPGDTIKLEVYAKYVDPNRSNLTGALTTLLTQIANGTAPAGTVVDGAGYATNGNIPFLFAGLNNTSGSTGTGPKAYLNWLVFDRNFAFKNGGYVRMTTAAKENGANVAHERLFKQLVIREPGYVYMYLSNEETTPLEVYFDDASVTQVKGPVIQQNDYDPFGLTFNEYARENSAPNNFLYNGKELQNDFALNWYDYGARMYDAALGRWHVIDPKAEKYAAWSPYNYVVNNPVLHIDPKGKDLIIWYYDGKRARSYRYTGGNPKNLPKNNFVRSVVKAYLYNVGNGGGKNLKQLATSCSVSINVVSGNALLDNGWRIRKGDPDLHNGYNGDKKITWAESAIRFNLMNPDQKVISSATILEGLAYQALLGTKDRNQWLDLMAADPTGEFHHLIDRRVAEGPEKETAVANKELKEGETVPIGVHQKLWPAAGITSTDVGVNTEDDQ